MAIYLPFRERDRFFNQGGSPRIFRATNKWLAGWSYRKWVTVSRPTGAVANYQMKLLVGGSSGATGEDVDCGGKCLSTFNDLRFTKSDGTTLLDYWIESITGTTPNQLATVWIEFDSIGTDPTAFYMYYGSVSATSLSNGANTFPFFDDFTGAYIDTDKWNTSGTIAVSGGEVSLNEDDQIYGKTAFGLGYTVRAKSKADEQDICFVEWWADINNRCDICNSDAFYANDFEMMQFTNVKTSSNEVFLDNSEDFRNNYAIYEIFRDSSSSVKRAKYGASDTYTNEYTNSIYIVSGNMYPSLRVWDSSQASTLICDWILVRQQLATEPAWGSWGREEEL